MPIQRSIFWKLSSKGSAWLLGGEKKCIFYLHRMGFLKKHLRQKDQSVLIESKNSVVEGLLWSVVE